MHTTKNNKEDKSDYNPKNNQQHNSELNSNNNFFIENRCGNLTN